MTARTDRERARSDTALAMPVASRDMLIKILARTAGAAFDSAMELVDDIEGAAPAPAPAGPAPLAAVPTAAQDRADWEHGPAEEARAWPPVTYLSCGDVLPADLVIGSTAECPRHGRKVTVLSPVDYAAGLGEGPAGAGFPGPAACGHCGETVPHSHRDDPEPGEAWPMGHLASLAGRLAERATPGAGDPQ